MSYSVDIAELEGAFDDAGNGPFNGEFYVTGEFRFSADFENLCDNVINHFGYQFLEMRRTANDGYFACQIRDLIFVVRSWGPCEYGWCFSVFAGGDLRVTVNIAYDLPEDHHFWVTD